MTWAGKALLVALLSIASAHTAVACTVPKPGYGMDHDELISTADTIVLVRFRTRATLPEDGRMVRYTLETVETLKGKAQSSYQFMSYDSHYSRNDFEGHRGGDFWTKNTGRSAWFCCICGPDHSFREGHVYLYFPDKLGAMKSAEVIPKNSDRWLQYVRAKVKIAANPPSQGPRPKPRAPEFAR